MSDYKMPAISVGDTVLWHADADPQQQGTPAQVIRVDAQTIDLMLVFGAERLRDAVRHASDPKLVERPKLKRDGSWTYTESHKRLLRLESMLDELLKPTPKADKKAS